MMMIEWDAEALADVFQPGSPESEKLTGNVHGADEFNVGGSKSGSTATCYEHCAIKIGLVRRDEVHSSENRGNVPPHLPKRRLVLYIRPRETMNPAQCEGVPWGSN